jgi:hypothetical protein
VADGQVREYPSECVNTCATRSECTDVHISTDEQMCSAGETILPTSTPSECHSAMSPEHSAPAAPSSIPSVSTLSERQRSSECASVYGVHSTSAHSASVHSSASAHMFNGTSLSSALPSRFLSRMRGSVSATRNLAARVYVTLNHALDVYLEQKGAVR